MKYIIFDFDGTIGDSQALIVKTLQDTMRKRGLEVKSDVECAATIGLRLDEAFVQLFEMSAEEGMACAETYRVIFEENKQHLIVQPFPHVLETIHTLHRQGYQLAIASSRGSDSLFGYVKQMGIEDCISSIIAGDLVEHVKPAPDMVFKALEEMNGTVEEALVVGDMTYDVDMAHNAGAKACAVTYGNATREELKNAEYIIDDFAELLDILQEK
nr:HAD-IA family hydrolase [uncultured Prevotella sp.]